MPRITRKALVALLITLHASIMLLGAGLHAAPGIGHARSWDEASQTRGGEPSATTALLAPEHCPVCDYLAQGQLPIEQAPTVSERFVGRFTPPFPLPLELRLWRAPSRSRAPPLLSLPIV